LPAGTGCQAAASSSNPALAGALPAGHGHGLGYLPGVWQGAHVDGSVGDGWPGAALLLYV